MNQHDILSEFQQRVESLHEVEYGDFKRKIGLYLNRLTQQLPSLPPEAAELINALKERIIYNPRSDIEAARQEILETAERMAKILNLSGPALHSHLKGGMNG